MSNEQLLTKSMLKERGWNEALITKFLPVPDQAKPNPHYKSGPSMKLYSRDRVVQAEASTAFQEASSGRAAAREAAQKAVATKRAKMKAYLESVKIKVPQLSEHKLIDLACDHYNARSHDDSLLASPKSDEEFLHRITVNFLRHELSEYEHHLAKIGGKVGAADAYLKIKNKVLDAIAEAYPWLRAECFRQGCRMWNERGREE